MGLSYYDHGQFLDAVKRNDELAVELFIAGKGVEPEQARLERPHRARHRARQRQHPARRADL